jgi:hypothetical protein
LDRALDRQNALAAHLLKDLPRGWKIAGISEITAKATPQSLPSPLAGAFFLPKNR